MFTYNTFSHTLQLIPVVLFVLLFARLVFNKYGHGINAIPGPRLAGFTGLWRLFVVWGGHAEQWHIKLYEKYGNLVRLGPNTVLVSDPSAIPIIYATKGGFVKSNFYPVQQALNPQGIPIQGIFNTTDVDFHAKLHRVMAAAYTMSSLVQFEPFVDSATEEFLRQLEDRFEHDICNFGKWLQFYAFDVIGELAFSQRLGFIEEGQDIGGIMGTMGKYGIYVAVVGQTPQLDKWLMKNPIRVWLGRIGAMKPTSPIVKFCLDCMRERAGGEFIASEKETSYRRDFLSRFIEARQKNPEFVTPDRVVSMTISNIFAGFDTTAISLRAIFYYLLKNPSDMAILMEELRYQKEAGIFSRKDGLVLYSEVRELPFLNAVIKEALRVHPAVGLMLERVVPSGGVTLHGQFIPEGTVVGANAWVLHRDKQIFGDQPEIWRPQRWLEASKEQKRIMENSLFSFGAGTRACTGRNISYLEMYKVVPALLMRFEIKLADPTREWTLYTAFFVSQSDFYVKLKKRTDTGITSKE